MAFIVIVLIIFQAAPLNAQESDGRITLIEVIGLGRTKPHVAEYPLEKFLGLGRSEFDLNEVFAAVKDTNVLEPVAAELVESPDGTEGLLLRVTVEEKWALFIVPRITFGSGGENYGLYMIDVNAFGLRDWIELEGSYGQQSAGSLSMYGGARYVHTSSNKSLPGWSAAFRYFYRERADVDRDGFVRRRYTSNMIRPYINVNYGFTDLFSGSFSFLFVKASVMENENDLNPPDMDAALLGFNPAFSIRRSSWDGFLLSEKSISLGFYYYHAVSGSSFCQLEYRGIYEQSLLPGFRFIARSSGFWIPNGDARMTPLFEEGPGKVMISILPRNFSALGYIGLTAGLEKYLFKVRWGTLSFQGSWQGVFSYSPLSDSGLLQFDHGPSAGLLFYVSRIAMPAIGAGAAYNMNSGLFQFNINIGIAF